MKARVTGWSSWTADAGVLEPELLPVRQRRRASRLTRMAAHVLGRLGVHERPEREVESRVGMRVEEPVDFEHEAMVFGSCYGEMAVTVALLRMMHRDDGALSPMRFSGSVHNAALGQVSIATSNRGFSTSVSAGADTVAMTLLEAVACLNAGHPSVLVVWAEEPLPEPLDRERNYGGLAAALRLVPQSSSTGATLELQGPGANHSPDVERPLPPVSLRENPLASALGLIRALDGGQGTVALRPRDPASWWASVMVEGSR